MRRPSRSRSGPNSSRRVVRRPSSPAGPVRPVPSTARSGVARPTSTAATATRTSVRTSATSSPGATRDERGGGGQAAADGGGGEESWSGHDPAPPPATGHRVELRRAGDPGDAADHRDGPCRLGRARWRGRAGRHRRRRSRRRRTRRTPRSRGSATSGGSPSTARHASSGRPRWRTEALSATSPVSRPTTPSASVAASGPASVTASQPPTSRAPTATWVSVSMTASGRCPWPGWTSSASSGARSALSGRLERYRVVGVVSRDEGAPGTRAAPAGADDVEATSVGHVDERHGDGALRTALDARRRLADRQAVAAQVALADDAEVLVERRHLVGTRERAVAAADAGVVEVADDAGVGILLVGIGRAAVEAGGLEAVVAGVGHGLHRGRADVVGAVQRADPSPALTVVEAVEAVAGGDAGLAAGARVEVDVEGVLLAGRRRGHRESVAPAPRAGVDQLVGLAGGEPLDRGELLLGAQVLVDRGDHVGRGPLALVAADDRRGPAEDVGSRELAHRCTTRLGGRPCQQHPGGPFPGSCPVVNRTSLPAHDGRRPS